MSAPTSPQQNQNLPMRSGTTMSDDTPVGEDVSEVTKLLHERLQAYKHACGYLEEYVKSTEKMQTQHSKEYEKVLKTVNQPLKEGDQFDRQLGGISEMFDTIRNNTQGIANSHIETARNLKGNVLPVFERLHQEIKHKQSEIQKGVGKNTKQVDKARNETNRHIEKLGQNSATFDNHAGKVDPMSDPYIVQKGVYHRLNKQIQEENSTRQDMLTVQENFSQFETHIVQTLQQGMGQLMQVVGNQADSQKNLYGQMTEVAQKIPPLFEWERFVQRSHGVLIDPKGGPRTLDSATFSNQNHHSTKPVIQGSLARKTGMLKKYDNAFYAITPAKFLHEFKDEDDLAKDPAPELSLYLPECTLGALDGTSFSVKGKDVSKGKLGTAATHTVKEYEFRTNNTDNELWYNVIRSMTSSAANETATPLSPSSSVKRSDTTASTSTTGATSSPGNTQTTGQTQGVVSPTTGTAGTGEHFATRDPVQGGEQGGATK